MRVPPVLQTLAKPHGVRFPAKRRALCRKMSCDKLPGLRPTRGYGVLVLGTPTRAPPRNARGLSSRGRFANFGEKWGGSGGYGSPDPRPTSRSIFSTDKPFSALQLPKSA